MRRFGLSIRVDTREKYGVLLAPAGISTPLCAVSGRRVTGGQVRELVESHTGQTALSILPGDDEVEIGYDCRDGRFACPEAVFARRVSPHMRASVELVDEVAAIAPFAPPLERVREIACATARHFVLGVPEHAFNEGFTHVPALGSTLVEGDSLDITTYFVASLRSAGIEAGLVTGCTFPDLRGEQGEAGHCWAVTRIDGTAYEWDIARHLAAGARDIRPGPGPAGGLRVALTHSLGLDFPNLGLHGLKLLAEPLWVSDGNAYLTQSEIRLDHPDLKRPLLL